MLKAQELHDPWGPNHQQKTADSKKSREKYLRVKQTTLNKKLKN